MFENKEGAKIPQVTFRTRKDGDWVNVTSDDIFKDKKVVLFALPGAFTPTCSSSHLPRYSELLPQFRKAGVDTVACLSVNDGFVMEAWGKDQNIEDLTLLPDGNGEFSKEMGFLVDKNELGFGPRSWRYAMVVNNGVVEKMFIEPEKDGDPFEVSDADTVLNYLAPDAELPPEVTILTKDGCPFCATAKSILKEKSLKFEEITLGSGVSYATVRNLTGESTVPQVFINGKHIGDSEKLGSYLKDNY